MIAEMNTGDRIKKRGFSHEGRIVKKDEAWATIEWDDGVLARERPKMCHLRELETLK